MRNNDFHQTSPKTNELQQLRLEYCEKIIIIIARVSLIVDIVITLACVVSIPEAWRASCRTKLRSAARWRWALELEPTWQRTRQDEEGQIWDFENMELIGSGANERAKERMLLVSSVSALSHYRPIKQPKYNKESFFFLFSILLIYFIFIALSCHDFQCVNKFWNICL